MNLFNWPLDADSAKTWYGEGRHLRLLAAPEPVEVEIVYASGTTAHTAMIAGIGVDLAHPETGEKFKALTFRSEVAQTLKVLVTAFPSSDSRLTGDVDINGLLQVVSVGGGSRALSSVTVPAGGAAEILPAQPQRQGAYVAWDGSLHIGVDATVTATTGVRVDGGLTDSNTSALWAFNASAAPVVVRVLEDRR